MDGTEDAGKEVEKTVGSGEMEETRRNDTEGEGRFLPRESSGTVEGALEGAEEEEGMERKRGDASVRRGRQSGGSAGRTGRRRGETGYRRGKHAKVMLPSVPLFVTTKCRESSRIWSVTFLKSQLLRGKTWRTRRGTRVLNSNSNELHDAQGCSPVPLLRRERSRIENSRTRGIRRRGTVNLRRDSSAICQNLSLLTPMRARVNDRASERIITAVENRKLLRPRGIARIHRELPSV